MNDKMEYDLFNNPMVEIAKKAMTPQQLEEYKKIGEYMYNSDTYKTLEQGSKVTDPKDEDIVSYALESIKSGLDPKDLSQKELTLLVDVYGPKWYEQFHLLEKDVPKPMIQMVRELKEETEKLSRKDKRALDKLKQKKDRISLQKKRETSLTNDSNK